MRLQRVTITGADDSVHPSCLLDLSKQFPFVEWGLLFKYQHDDAIKPRWPRLRWFESLFEALRGESATPRFSLHLCGMALVRFLEGSQSFADPFLSGLNPLESVPWGLFQLCRRMQLNTHGEPTGWAPQKMAAIVNRYLPMMQIICQIDGGAGESILNELLAEEVDAYAFHDLSHGAGISPETWPEATYIGQVDLETGRESIALHGYAGGLGADNLEAELARIAEAASGGPFWIDTETKMRSVIDGRDVFDLGKVQRFLEICAPHVEAE